MTAVERKLILAGAPFEKADCSGYNGVLEDGLTSLKTVLTETISNSLDVKEFSVVGSTLCNEPGFSAGYVVISWTEKAGDLHTSVFEWDTY